MKKLTLFAIALLASIASFAALNPYAYGLSSALSADKTKLTVNYSLNAPATAVNIVVLDGKTIVKFFPCEGKAKGTYSVEIPTTEFPTGKKLTWKVEVSGASVKVPTQETTMYSMYCPHGLAIDTNPDSEYFGRILVAEAMQAVPASGYVSSGKGAGLYVFNPDFTTDQKVHNGGLDFTRILASNGYQPYRVKISEDGRIFVSSLDLNGVVVWEVSKDLQTWNPVISGTNNATDYNIYDAKGNFVAGLNCSMDVIGSGEDLKLLLYSTNNKGIAFNQSGYRLDEYALGTATTWTGTPKNILTGGKYGVAHTNVEWIYDGEGGYWFGASRAGNAGQPNLVHINAAGEQDYYTEDASLYGGDGVLLHNGMLFKGKARSSETIGNFGVWTVGKDADGKVTLTEKWTVVAKGIGRNLNEFAIDYAENLYVVGNSGEKIIAYALPYSGMVATPAASKYTFHLGNLPPEYIITATANNETMGTVSGAGTYVKDTEVELTATPKTGHEFVNWSNGSTDNPLVFAATENVELTANFKALQYTVTVGVNDETKGSVTNAGEHTLDYGTELVLKATPAEGYRFAKWSNEETANPLTITVSGDLEITALFENTNITARAWAYDLSLETADDTYTLSFKATTPADATIIFTNAEGEEVGTHALGTIAAGTNKISLTTDQLPEVSELYWAVKMAYDDVIAIREVTDQSRGIYDFYNMMDVLVDNNPESNYFGEIYVQMALAGTTNGKAQTPGLFIFNQELNLLNENPNAGIQPTLPDGYTMGGDRTKFHRLDIDPKTGNLTYCYNISNKPAVFAMDRANLTGEVTNLVAGIDGLLRTSAHCFDADGTLYVYDYDARVSGSEKAIIYKIKDGVKTQLTEATTKFVQHSVTLASDGKDGLWVGQNRSAMDGYYQLVHVTAAGELDYIVNSSNTHGFTGGSSRGALAYDAERHILAQGRDGAVELFSVTYNAETGVPTLTKFATTPYVGYNIDGLHFDYAGDLYVVNSSNEKFQKFVVPTNNNTCTTPAPKALVITKPSNPTVLDNTVVAPQVEKIVRNGQVLIIRDGKTYNMMGQEVK